MEIRKTILALLMAIPILAMSQQDTTAVEDTIDYEFVDFEEYLHVTKFFVNSYPERGTDGDDVLDTIAAHIRKSSLFTTNKDVNVRVCDLARQRRKNALAEMGHSNATVDEISDYIEDKRAIKSIYSFAYMMSDSLKDGFVMRVFDRVQQCDCAESIFESITEFKFLTYAMESPKLKWMTFTYFQHSNDEGLVDEYIFVRWKNKWSIFSNEFTIIMEE